MAAKPETVVEKPVTPDNLPHEPVKSDALKVATEKKPAHAPKGVVRSVGHLDDTANGGKYYRPGDVIEGWDQATIDRMVENGVATVEGA